MSKESISKADLIKLVSDKTGQTNKAAGEVINALLETITDNVAKGNDVSVIGFGKFSPSERRARKGRNPKTGQEIEIAAATLPKFTPGKSFKDTVNS